jgi:hypothetical protein
MGKLIIENSERERILQMYNRYRTPIIEEVEKAELVNNSVSEFLNTLNGFTGQIEQQKVGSIKFEKVVETFQIGLELLGYDLPKYGVDGKFGPETGGSLKRFQTDNGMPASEGAAIFDQETSKKMADILKGKNLKPEQISVYTENNFNDTSRLEGIGSTNVNTNQEITNTIYQNLTSKGLTPAQATGIMGNLFQESSFNPTALGDNGESYGLAQWRGVRRENLEQFCKESYDVKCQMDFMWWELNYKEERALKELQKTKTPADAALAFAKYYERPQTIERKRMEYANGFYNQLKNQSS